MESVLVTSATEPLPSSTRDALVRSHLRGRLLWLIRLRWYATAAVIAVTAAAAALSALAAPLALVSCAILLALGNVVFTLLARAKGPTPTVAWSQSFILAQIIFDLAVLTTLLELAGGVENPFVLLYVLHMAVAGVLLSTPKALLAGLVACLLYGIALVIEIVGLVPHFPIRLGSHDIAGTGPADELWESPVYAVAQILAFAISQFGVILLIQQIVRRFREAEAKHLESERVAASRERLARIGALTAGVAHSIRNPLHGLLNVADALKRDTPADAREAHELLDVMQEGVSRIETVTRRLLTLSLDAPLQCESLELATLVEDALRFARMRARSFGVPVHVALDELPAIEVDAARLVEALANLVDNAIYACRQGGAVTIRATRSADDAAALLSVEDTGEGIPTDALPRVFDPFYTTKPIGEGTGLGLAIARRAVEMHGGTIGVESQPGAGTVVRLAIPWRARRDG